MNSNTAPLAFNFQQKVGIIVENLVHGLHYGLTLINDLMTLNQQLVCIMEYQTQV